MGEFVSMEEDWGLQAIVRGSTDYFDDPAISSFGSLNYIQNNNNNNNDDHFHFTFPDLFEANYNMYSNNDKVLVNELDELYKPFYPMFNSFSPQAPIITSSSDSFPEEVLKLDPEDQEIQVIQKHTIPGKSAKVTSPKSTTAHAAKYKRKNQHKRVVVQVTADGLSSDLWAWRKYGQKPIKGSPYPRSYYRCSSLKGCLARKQVEQSCTDPGMFIITYSGEHGHSQPTRRSSLAGTNRHKFTTPKSPSSVDTCTSSVATPKDSSCSPTSDISEEVVILQQPIKHEQKAEEISKDDEFVISNMILNDDFFVGLEDLDALISTSTFYNCSREHFR